ncbi:N-6 DNA methylase [Kitasatospora sp. NPDC057692]|uniref:N-6 DNA methylase n=1 Tax=Kitasatospora sp. NPDC057692 TaxID=3346215 RepID=UPI003690F57F
MTEAAEPLFSRSEIAEYAGVKRPAVTNWERRHSDYPRPVAVEGSELFRGQEVAAWLSTRVIPVRSLLPGEAAGTTYGDRFRRSVQLPAIDDRAGTATHGHDAAQSAQMAHALLGAPFEPWRQTGRASEYLQILLILVFVRGLMPEEWRASYQEARWDRNWFHQFSRLLPEEARPVGDSLLMRLDDQLSESDLRALDHAEWIINSLDSRAQAAALFEHLLLVTAEREGPRSSELVTPPSLRRLMVELATDQSTPTKVYDPYCRSGELLTEFARARTRLTPTYEAVVSTPIQYHQFVTALNLGLHDVPFKSRLDHDLPAPPAAAARRMYDLVLSNPPFSMRARYGTGFDQYDWPFGAPPRHNADLGWLQHVVESLAPGGRAVVVMANGAAFRRGREKDIRGRLLEAGAVDAVIALPRNLFSSTGVAVSLWLLRCPNDDRTTDVFFLDAHDAGSMVTRTLRALTDADITDVISEYRSWRRAPRGFEGRRTATWSSGKATFAELRDNDFVLEPTRYVRPSDDKIPDRESVLTDIGQLYERLRRLHGQAQDVDEQVKQLLNGMT